MITNEQLLYHFDGYYLEKIEYIKKDFSEEEAQIEGTINVRVSYPENLDSCKVYMDVDIFPEEGPFNLKTTICGEFSFKDPSSKDSIEHFIKFNGIGTLTAYLRSAITDITKAANMAPLVMPYINPTQFVIEENLEE